MKATVIIRTGTIFTIFLTVVCVAAIPCWFLLFDTYGYLNNLQFIGYLLVFVSCGLSTVIGCIAAFSLLKKKKRAKLVKYVCIFYTFPSILNLGAIVLLPNIFSSGSMTRDFLHDYFRSHKKIPPIMEMIQQLHNCCGVYSYKDYLDSKDAMKMIFDPLPNSCCRSEYRNTKECAKEVLFMNSEGCFVIPGTQRLRGWYIPYYDTGFWLVMTIPVGLFLIQLVTLLAYTSVYHLLDRINHDEFLVISKDEDDKLSKGDNQAGQNNDDDDEELAEQEGNALIESAAKIIREIESKEQQQQQD